MKITKQRLRQIIKEELQEGYRTDRTMPVLSDEDVYPSKRERSTHDVVSQADMDAAMATEQDVRKDLERAVMIAYEIDRNITPENTELMREIDDIMSRHGIGFEEEPEAEEEEDVEAVVLKGPKFDPLGKSRKALQQRASVRRGDK